MQSQAEEGGPAGSRCCGMHREGFAEAGSFCSLMFPSRWLTLNTARALTPPWISSALCPWCNGEQPEKWTFCFKWILCKKCYSHLHISYGAVPASTELSLWKKCQCNRDAVPSASCDPVLIISYQERGDSTAWGRVQNKHHENTGPGPYPRFTKPTVLCLTVAESECLQNVRTHKHELYLCI